MSPQSRLYAQHAAQEFLTNELGDNTYIGIFSLDYKLNALEQYTNNRDKLTAAIGKAATGNYSDFRRQSDIVLNNTRITLGSTVEVSGGGQGAPAVTVHAAEFHGGEGVFQSPGQAVAGAEAGSPLSQQQMGLARLEQHQLEMVTSGIGWRALEGLMNVVRAQSALPGRKTILLLSEGLIVPPQAEEMFRSIVSTANRANVSIYGLDVTGLTTRSSARAGVDRMSGVSGLSRAQKDLESGDDVHPSAVMEAAQQDDQLHLALSADAQAKFQELAENTGGFLIANTNDLRKPLSRVMEDARTHYEVAYSPASTNYDGHFRRIEVKIRRKDARVQSRNGYFALPLLGGEALQPFEMACLKVLDAGERKDDFEFRATALRFEPTRGEVQHEMVFEVPMKNVTFTEVTNTGKLRTHLSFLGLIKNDNGQVVEKLSRDINMEFPPDKKANARSGNIVFNQPFRLAPGKYTLEAAALDREGDEASTRKSVLLVQQGASPALSNLVVVRRLEPLQGERDLNDPLQTATGRVVPAINNAAPTGTDVPLYFIVYPAKSTARPAVSMELYRNGKLVTRKELDLPQAGDDGLYRFLTAISPDPGNYEIRLQVRQGEATATQVLPLTVGISR